MRENDGRVTGINYQSTKSLIKIPNKYVGYNITIYIHANTPKRINYRFPILC